MQQKVKLHTEVVQVDKDDISLEGAQISISKEGDVKGAFSYSGDYAIYCLWLFVIIFLVISILLRHYDIKKNR